MQIRPNPALAHLIRHYLVPAALLKASTLNERIRLPDTWQVQKNKPDPVMVQAAEQITAHKVCCRYMSQSGGSRYKNARRPEL